MIDDKVIGYWQMELGMYGSMTNGIDGTKFTWLGGRFIRDKYWYCITLCNLNKIILLVGDINTAPSSFLDFYVGTWWNGTTIQKKATS